MTIETLKKVAIIAAITLICAIGIAAGHGWTEGLNNYDCPRGKGVYVLGIQYLGPRPTSLITIDCEAFSQDFENVYPGDRLYVDAAQFGQAVLDIDTFFQVSGSGRYRLSTGCTQALSPGMVFGPFKIFYVEACGKSCVSGGTPPAPPECEVCPPPDAYPHAHANPDTYSYPHTHAGALPYLSPQPCDGNCLDQINRVYARLIQLENRMQGLEVDEVALDRELIKVRADLTSKIQDLQSQITAVHNDTKQTIDQINCRIDAIQLEAEKTKQKLQQNIDQVSADSTQKINSLRSEISRVETRAADEISRLERIIQLNGQEEQQRVQALEQKMNGMQTSMDRRVLSLEAQLQGVKWDMGTNTARIAALESSVPSLKEQVSALKDRVTQLESRVAALQDKLNKIVNGP